MKHNAMLTIASLLSILLLRSLAEAAPGPCQQ